MPIYDLRCDKCGKTIKDHLTLNWNDLPLCCGQEMTREVSTKVNFPFPKDGVTIEHCGPNPVHFNTLGELKKYEKEHDMDIGA